MLDTFEGIPVIGVQHAVTAVQHGETGIQHAITAVHLDLTV